MVLSFNINILTVYIFIARPNPILFNYINERGTSVFDYKHKHMLQKMELHLTNLVPCTLCNCRMILTAGSMFQGYHTLVPGINLNFYGHRDGMGPFKIITYVYCNISKLL